MNLYINHVDTRSVSTLHVWRFP